MGMTLSAPCPCLERWGRQRVCCPHLMGKTTPQRGCAPCTRLLSEWRRDSATFTNFFPAKEGRGGGHDFVSRAQVLLAVSKDQETRVVEGKAGLFEMPAFREDGGLLSKGHLPDPNPIQRFYGRVRRGRAKERRCFPVLSGIRVALMQISRLLPSQCKQQTETGMQYAY